MEGLEPRHLLSITVTTLADQNDGINVGGISLRDAAAHAATLSGTQTIEFDESLNGGTVELTLGQITIASNINIAGPGASSLTIDANGSTSGPRRIFTVNGSKQATISGVTLTGGYVNATGNNTGGAILNNGDLTLNSVVVVDNYASVSGGGVYSNAGKLWIEDSTFLRNTAGSTGGGAIYTNANITDGLKVERSAFINNKAGNSGALYLGGGDSGVGTAHIVNSTFSANSATAGEGGAIRNGSGSPLLTIRNSTITNNVATSYGGGIVRHSNSEAQITLHNSIVAGNISGTGASTNNNNIYRSMATASSYNIIGVGGPGGLVDNNQGNRVGMGVADLGLAPLGEYGGSTKTHALLEGSLAIDKGANSNISGVSTDQRGFDRIVDDPTQNGSGDIVDIGAFEFGAIVVVTADFNGDGRRADFATYDALTGTLVAFLQSDRGIDSNAIGLLGTEVTWDNFQVGDFNGDGRDDILVQNTTTNEWSVAISEGTQFVVHELGISRSFADMFVGDFDGDQNDELLGYAEGTAPYWEVLDFSETFGASITSWGNAILGGSISPAVIHIGDVNRDGRDDLVTKNTSSGTTQYHWYVGLSQPAANSTNTFLEQDWGSWFEPFASGTNNAHINDVDAAYQTLLDTFSEVYNTVELEFYPGLMKGPTATQETHGGNDWDQAALLVSMLPSEFQATIVSGQVTVSLEDARKWVGAKSTNAVEEIIEAAFDPLAGIPSGTQTISFKHALVQVKVPTVAGLETKYLDPSWKFKEYQSGTDSIAFDEFKFLAQAGHYFKDLSTSEAAARELPLEFFEDELSADLINNHTGTSLAEQMYAGVIVQKAFTQIPVWDVSGATSHGTFAEIVANDADKAQDELLTHRVRVSVGTSPTVTSWTWTEMVPAISLSSIIIKNQGDFSSGHGGFTSRLFVDGVEKSPSSPVPTLSGAQKLFVEFFSPGESTPMIGFSEWKFRPNDNNNNSDQNETLAVSLGVSQYSTAGLGNKLKEALSVDADSDTSPDDDGIPDLDDVDDLLAYSGAKYWFDLDTSSEAIAGYTHTARTKGVQAALLRASGSLVPRGTGGDAITQKDIQNTPFNLFPSSVSMDVARVTDGQTWFHEDGQSGSLTKVGNFLDLTSGAIHDEAVQLFAYQYSALEHTVMEEVIPAEGVSAVKALQFAFSEARQVDFDHTQGIGNENHIRVLQYSVNASKVELRHIHDYRHKENGNYENGDYIDTNDVSGLLWTSNSTWSPGWTPTTTDLEHSSNGLYFKLDSFLDGEYPGGTSGELRYEMVRMLADQVRYVVNGTPSTILLPKSRVRIGDDDNYINNSSNDAEWWQGAGYIVDHSGGRFQVRTLRTPKGSPDISDGGAVGGNVVPITQPTGSFVNQSSANSVGTANGNVSRHDTDILFPNSGVPLALDREYNSQSTYRTTAYVGSSLEQLKVPIDAGMGIGWTHSFSDQLIHVGRQQENQEKPDLLWVKSDGTRHLFEYNSNGYAVPSELFVEFKDDPNGIFRILGRDGTEYHFERASLGSDAGKLYARLSKKIDINGQGIAVIYDDLGEKPQQILSVVDFRSSGNLYTQNGRLEFQYGSETPNSDPLDADHITAIKKYVTTTAGEQLIGTWNYGYGSVSLSTPDIGDNGRRLTSVMSPTDSFITTSANIEYQYTDASLPIPAQGLLKKVIEPNGHYVSYEYYHNGRAFRVQQSTDLPAADDGIVSTLYHYNFVQDRTQTIGPLNRVETFVYQNNGLETRQIHADRSRVETTWGITNSDKKEEFRVTSMTDEVGAVQKLFYYQNVSGSGDDFKIGELEYVSEKHFTNTAGFVIGRNGARLGTETTVTADFTNNVLLTHYDYLKPESRTHVAIRSHIWVDPNFTSGTHLFDPNGQHLTTDFERDAVGRVTRITDPEGNEKQFYYYPETTPANYSSGLLVSTLDAIGLAEDHGIGYRNLNEFNVSGTTLTVKLKAPSSPNGRVVADAVRIDRVGDIGSTNVDVVETRILDNESPTGFSTTESASPVNQHGTLSPLTFGATETLLSANATASWVFTGLLPGRYRISVSLDGNTSTSSPNATNARYELYDGVDDASPNETRDPVDQKAFPDFFGHETVFSYDAAGNVTQTRYEGFNQAASSNQFDHNGRPTVVTDRTGVAWNFEYDKLGRQRTAGLGDPDGPTGALTKLLTTHGYDASGRRTSTADPLGNTEHFAYDGRNLLVKHTNPDGKYEEFKYDDVGNLISRTDELNRTTQFAYDTLNRLVQTVHPDGTSDRIEYDGLGRVVKTVDAKNHATLFKYDAMGRVLSTTNADNNSASNEYDKLGRVVRTIDYRGVNTVFKHDKLSRVTETRVLDKDTPTDPPKFLSTTDYDRNGNVSRSVIYDVAGLGTAIPAGDPRGLITSHPTLVQVMETKYDSLNRPIEAIYVDAQVDGSGDTSMRTMYDGAGRVRITIDELGRQTQVKYDKYGRLEQSILPDPDGSGGSQTSPITTRLYDKASNVVAITDANANTIYNRFDTFNRLVETTDAEGNSTRSLYDIAGQMIATIDALGRAAYVRYDNRGRAKLQRMPDPDGAAGPLSAPTTSYEYDPAGNLSGMIGPNGYRTTYQYDELNRLEKEFTTDVQISDEDAAVVTPGAPATTSGVEGAFGRDHKTIAGTATVAPVAKWTFADLPAGQYRVSMTWDGATGVSLDANAMAQVQAFNNGGTTAQITRTETANQSADPQEFALDYQGQWRGWQEIDQNQGTVTVNAGGRIEVTLTGHTNTSIRADAVMLDRVVESSSVYDENGNVTSQTDTLGRTTTYAYDELGRLERTTLPDPDQGMANGGPGDSNLQSPVIEYTYDGYGNVKQIKELRGTAADRVTDHTYDKRNRLTKLIENFADGTYSSAAVDTDVITQYVYDEVGNLTALVEASGDTNNQVTTRYEYDNLDRLKTELLDAANATNWKQKTEYGYDAVGNVLTSKFFVQDLSGTPKQESVTTTYVYDRANRVIREIGDSGGLAATTQYSYDKVDNLVQEMDPTGRANVYLFDRLNRQIKSTLPDPDGSGTGLAPTMSYVYDVLGNVARTTNRDGETTQSIYDTLGREINMFDGEGNETRYRYDSEGNLIKLSDAEGNATAFIYDRLNRGLTETIVDEQQQAQSRRSIFNDAGNLAETVDRNDRVRKFTYDLLDQLKQEQWFTNAADFNADSTLTWDYDVLGRVNLAKQVDAASTVLYVETFDYDRLDRVMNHRNFEPGQTAVNPQVTLAYTYDLLNSATPGIFATAVKQTIGTTSPTDIATTTYSTDRLGRQVKISDDVSQEASAGKSDKTVAFTYDLADRLATIVRDSVADAFDLDTIYAYDGTGRLSAIDHTRQNGASPSAAFDYGYDVASRITQTVSTFDDTNIKFTRTQSYGYDNAGRLTGSGGNYVNNGSPGLGFAIDNDFTLDGTGNRESTSVDGAMPVNAAIDPNNQLHDDGTYNYVYDDEGNLIEKRIGTWVATSYSWDHRNRLVSVTDWAAEPDAIRVTYAYNTDNLRVQRGIGQVGEESLSRHFVYDGDHVALTIEADGDIDHRYLYAPGTDFLLVDEVFNEAGTVGQAERGYWALTDHAGTVHDLIESDADGTLSTNHNLVQHLDYDVSGRIARAIKDDAVGTPIALEALFSDFAFAGREWDGNAGLYYNRARWYDANTGRFLSEDPLGFAGGDANLYRYAAGDPTNFRDPSGEIIVGAIINTLANALGAFLEKEINGDDGSAGFSFSVGINTAGDVDYSAAVDINERRTPITPGQSGYYGPGVYGSYSSATGGAIEGSGSSSLVHQLLPGMSPNGIPMIGGFAPMSTMPQAGLIDNVEAYMIEQENINYALQQFQHDPYAIRRPYLMMPVKPNVAYNSQIDTVVDSANAAAGYARTVGEIGGSILFEPLDWAMTAVQIYNEPKNIMSYAGLIPFVPASVGKYGDDVVDATRGWLKRAPSSIPKTYDRPSGFRKGVREQAWDNAKGLDGKVRDPVTGRSMSFDEPWDMGHKPGYEFRKHRQSAAERGIDRQRFLDEYNDTRHYRPELPGSNRSHAGENTTGDYFGN